jgi:hypothetical protein
MVHEQGGRPAPTPASSAPAEQPRRQFSWPPLLAVVIAGTALTISMIGLTRSSSGSSPRVAISASPTTSASADIASHDRALCDAIAPLMAADDRASNTFIEAGPAGTPERDAAQARYRSDTAAWVTQIQPIANAHQDADPFLLRTLQRFIDDRMLMVRNMRPGPAKEYDKEIWADSLSALGGPMSVCYQLGVKW